MTLDMAVGFNVVVSVTVDVALGVVVDVTVGSGSPTLMSQWVSLLACHTFYLHFVH